MASTIAPKCVEVDCVDCGAEILCFEHYEVSARCDTCEDHHTRDCGTDCPIICERCREHHFDMNACGGRKESERRMTKLGRPQVVLPNGLTAEQHENQRVKLRLSKRDYAKKIGLKQATYCRKTKHVPKPEGFRPQNSKSSDHVDEHSFANELIKLATRLRAAERKVVEAENEMILVRQEIDALLKSECKP
jgi:hypothetical protein